MRKHRPAIYDCPRYMRQNKCAWLHYARGTSPRPVGECKKCLIELKEENALPVKVTDERCD